MNLIAKIQEMLGGEAVTGPIRTDFDLVRLIRRGVPTPAIDHFLRSSQLTINVIEDHVLSRRTFRRRQEKAQPLEPSESDRLVRLVRIVALAGETFGDTGKAMIWLHRESRALEGMTPLSLADTDYGAQSVETLLGKIGHGIAA